MAKRILALFTALLMLLSMAFFVGCDKKDANDDDDNGAKKELTAKEQFNASLEDALSGITNEAGNLTSSSLASKTDTVGSFLLTLDTLKYSGLDLSSLGDIAISGTMKSDVDTNLVSFDMTANLFGDEPTLGIITDANTGDVYFTDFLGLNESPLYIPASNSIDEEQLAAIQAYTENAEKIAEDLVKALTNAIDKNFNDSCYKSEKTTVTVNGVEFKNASVLTLTIDSTLAANVVRDFLTDVLKIEGLGELLENEIDVDEVLAEMSELESIVIKTVSADDKTVGINVDITADGETVSTRIALIKDNFKLEMGVIKEDGSYNYDEGVIVCDYVFDVEAGTQKAGLYMIEGDYTEYLFKLDATVENGVYDGRITMNMDGEEIYVDYVYESRENGGKITIENLDGLGVPFPVGIVIEYETTDSKFDFTMSMSCNDGEMEIAATLNYTLETGDVTIEEVTDYIDFDDFDMSNIEKDFKKLYPTLYSLLSYAGL